MNFTFVWHTHVSRVLYTMFRASTAAHLQYESVRNNVTVTHGGVVSRSIACQPNFDLSSCCLHTTSSLSHSL
jgi:hypothetical protein